MVRNAGLSAVLGCLHSKYNLVKGSYTHIVHVASYMKARKKFF